MDIASTSSENCHGDLLRIRDGTDEATPIEHTYCGTNIPPSVTSSAILLQFQSDNETEGTGFRAIYSTSVSGVNFVFFGVGREIIVRLGPFKCYVTLIMLDLTPS